MNKNEIYDKKSGLTYTKIGNYYIPKLKLPKEKYPNYKIGKYGILRLNYIKEHKKGFYTELMIKGTLTNHLAETEKIAQERFNTIIKQLKTNSNLTEEMKNTDQLKWVGMMNNFKEQANEIILKELIYI